MEKKLYAVVCNDDDERVIIPFGELEDYLLHVDDLDHQVVSFKMLTDEEYELLPDYSG